MATGWLMHGLDWLDGSPSPSFASGSGTIFQNNAENTYGLDGMINIEPNIAWYSKQVSASDATASIDFTPSSSVERGDTIALFGLAVMGSRYDSPYGGDKLRHTIPIHRRPVVTVSAFRSKSSANRIAAKSVTLEPRTFRFQRQRILRPYLAQFMSTSYWGNVAFTSNRVDINGSFRITIRVQIASGVGNWVLRVGNILHGKRIVPDENFSDGWQVRYSEVTDPVIVPGTFGTHKRRWPYRTANIHYEWIDQEQRRELERFYERVGSYAPFALMPDPDDESTLMYSRIPPRSFRSTHLLRYDADKDLSSVQLSAEEVVAGTPESGD